LRRSGGVAIGVAAAGVLSALLLAITEFLTVAWIELTDTGESCQSRLATDPSVADRCSLSGFERHVGVLILLAFLTLAMTWGASLGGSRPAAVALVVVGCVALGIGLLLDLPEAHRTGNVGMLYNSAVGKVGPGLYTELAAGILAVAAGAARLLRPK
jgi:hypothetical protein